MALREQAQVPAFYVRRERKLYIFSEKVYKTMGEGIGGCWHDKGAYKCLHQGYDFPLQQPVTAQSPAPSMLEWWWAQSCADSLCCEFVVDWPYRVQKIAFHTSFCSLALAFFCAPFSTMWSWTLCVYVWGEKRYDVLFQTELSTILCSQPFDQIWVKINCFPL